MTMLATIGSWATFASGWGDLDVLARLNWSFCVLPGLSGISTSVRGMQSPCSYAIDSCILCARVLLLENPCTYPQRHHSCCYRPRLLPFLPLLNWK